MSWEYSSAATVLRSPRSPVSSWTTPTPAIRWISALSAALTSKDFRFKIRVWFLQETPSVCPGCERGCNISVHHHDGRVYRLKPRRNDNVNDTWMCVAGRFGYKSLHENRLQEAAGKRRNR